MAKTPSNWNMPIRLLQHLIRIVVLPIFRFIYFQFISSRKSWCNPIPRLPSLLSEICNLQKKIDWIRFDFHLIRQFAVRHGWMHSNLFEYSAINSGTILKLMLMHVKSTPVIHISNEFTSKFISFYCIHRDFVLFKIDLLLFKVPSTATDFLIHNINFHTRQRSILKIHFEMSKFLRVESIILLNQSMDWRRENAVTWISFYTRNLKSNLNFCFKKHNL